MSEIPLNVLDDRPDGTPAFDPEPARSQLQHLIDGEVRFGHHDRMLYATDASIYQVEPLGVVIPRSIEDVARTVRWAAEHGAPLVPRGGGTSLAGQVLNRAVIMDFSVHCNAVIEIDTAARRARIEPGLVLDEFNRALAPHGLMFGPDVATSTHANLGGMIGNNSAGAHSILYGRTVENVIGLDVLLADGTALHLGENAAATDARVRALTQSIADIILPIASIIDERFPRTRRRGDGYNLDLTLAQLRASTSGTFDAVNLAHLITGSEGTLAVTTGAEVALVDRPKAVGLAIAGYASVDDALSRLDAVLKTNPAAVELLDDTVLRLAADNTETARYLDLMPRGPDREPAGAVLYVEYFRDDPAEIAAAFDDLDARAGASEIRRFDEPAAMTQAWRLRKSGEPLLCGTSDRRKPLTFIEDLAVDPVRLPEFVAAFRELVARHGTTAAYYAHASVGCLHIRPLIDLKDQTDVARMEAIAAEATDLVRSFGGALSGEHGDGRLRSHLLERFYGPEICAAFMAIKNLFDPEHRLNPGNLVSSPGMADFLRVRPEPDGALSTVPDVETFFRYGPEHGFAHAVEQCNGAGVCRKQQGGTMCPSYRATRDERHATRGRGNALRLAISGQLSDGQSPRWDDPDTIETLDLCLSCKACRTECPANVDIAKLKAEYTGQRYAAGARVPLSARLIANVRRLNQLGSVFPGLANKLSDLRLSRALLQKAAGISTRRRLPRFAASLYTWFDNRPAARSPDRRPVVVLFPDCFTVYNEPHVGRAAIRVLEACGYRVMLPRLGCCGRAALSVGLVEQAIETAHRTAEALLTCIDGVSPVAVVGCEPSCVSAIRDDWLDLKIRHDLDRLKMLASRTMLVEEFIESAWESHPSRPRWRTPDDNTPSLLLHAHCHQKALWGAESSAAALRRVCGDDALTVLDAGCCGMAGSFGYQTRHDTLSREIGELALFPAVEADPDATIVAPGFSCRHQVRDCTGRAAVHPIEVLASALGEGGGPNVRT